MILDSSCNVVLKWVLQEVIVHTWHWVLWVELAFAKDLSFIVVEDFIACHLRTRKSVTAFAASNVIWPRAIFRDW